MYVKATSKFKEKGVFPVELDFVPDEGYIFEVTEARFKTLSGANKYKLKFVEEVKTPPAKKKKKKGKKENKFAIIVPNRNYADWIEKCLNSILNQTYKNFEIVFVDDCSSDDSVQIAKKLLKKPHKVIQLKQQRFTGGARNEGYLNMSKDVDYVLCIDSDDWLLTDTALEEMNELLIDAPDVLFFGITEHVHGQDHDFRIPRYKDKYEALRGWSGCGKVIRKALATRQECLYHEGTLKEDKNQHCRICIWMDDFVCLEKPYYVWNRDNTKSVTTVREKVQWGTSTIRHWADTEELYLTVKGKDHIIDSYMEERLQKIKQEIRRGGDRQF